MSRNGKIIILGRRMKFMFFYKPLPRLLALFRRNIEKQKFMFYKDEGEVIPRFFLPVRWRIHTGRLECWVWYLAPIVWFSYTLNNMFWSLIKDAVEWGKLIEQKRRGFKNVK